jgi:protein kinase C-binding protein NELL
MNNSLTKEDGERWTSGCDECQCKSGEIKCIKKPCEVLKCKNPIMAEGECCPKCLSKNDFIDLF